MIELLSVYTKSLIHKLMMVFQSWIWFHSAVPVLLRCYSYRAGILIITSVPAALPSGFTRSLMVTADPLPVSVCIIAIRSEVIFNPTDLCLVADLLLNAAACLR